MVRYDEIALRCSTAANDCGQLRSRISLSKAIVANSPVRQAASDIASRAALRRRAASGGCIERAGSVTLSTRASKCGSSPVSMQARTSSRCAGRAVLHRRDQRQRRLAFAQVVADVLADLGRVAGVVQHVVDHLETRCPAPAVFGGGFRPARRRRRPARRPAARPASNSLAVFERITLQVALLVDTSGSCMFMQLQHFALGDHVGRVRQDLHDAHVASSSIIWKAREYRKSPTSTRRGIAEQRVGGLAAAPHRGLVHHVVVQQGRGMDEFDDGGQVEVLRAAVAEAPQTAAPAQAACACRRR